MIAFKILLGSELATLTRSGRFEGTSADLEGGFIHLSSAGQLDRVVEKHYAHMADVHLVAVAVDTLGEKIRWETASNGQIFPHLYGALNLTNVISYSPLQRLPNGSVEIPELSNDNKL
jgi:Uncharacterized protein conserved in bacteria